MSAFINDEIEVVPVVKSVIKGSDEYPPPPLTRRERLGFYPTFEDNVAAFREDDIRYPNLAFNLEVYRQIQGQLRSPNNRTARGVIGARRRQS